MSDTILLAVVVGVGVLIGLVVSILTILLHQERTVNIDLRRENERLLARIGWEYHIQHDRPSPQPADIPNIPTPASLYFRMKPDPRFLDPEFKLKLDDLDPSNTQ